MLKIVSVFVSLALLAVSVQAAGQFEGTWTSTISGGGSTFICQDGGATSPSSTLFGVYGEVGYFQGDVTNYNHAEGTWYNPIDPDCLSGGFQITAVDGGSADIFSGSWWCNGDSGNLHPWSESKLASARPDQTQCWTTTATNGNLENFWDNQDGEQLSLCTGDETSSNDTFFGSYYYPASWEGGVIRGYQEGDCFLDGTVCVGQWFEGPYQFGIEITRALSPDTIMTFWWWGTEPNYSPNAPRDNHGDVTYQRIPVDTTDDDDDDIVDEKDCNENEDFQFDPTDPDLKINEQNLPHTPSGQPISGASSLTASGLLMVVVAALAYLM
jgi:hypothetical protein